MVKEIKKLIADGKTKEALNLFLAFTSNEKHPLHYDSILLNSRFSIATNQHNSGVKSDSEFSAEVNKINKSLLSFISEIDDSIDSTKNRFAEEKELFNEYLNNWKDLVKNSSVTIDDKEFKSYQITKALCKKIRDLMDIEAIDLGRTLLWEDFETLNKLFYFKLAQAINGFEYFSDEFFAEKFREEFITDMKTMHKNDRWDYLKNHIGSRGTETESVKDALRTIGSVHFYKIDFERKEFHYRTVLLNIRNDYGEFVDGYILKDLLNSQLNVFDCLFLLYNLLARKIRVKSIENFRNFIDFNKLVFTDGVRSLMIDSISDKGFEKEIEFALDLKGEWPM